MENTNIIKRLIQHYIEGSELTQDEHFEVRSLEKQLEAINYTRCCTELKDKEGITFEVWLKGNCEYLNDDYYLYNEETYNRYDIHTKFITEIKQNL